MHKSAFKQKSSNEDWSAVANKIQGIDFPKANKTFTSDSSGYKASVQYAGSPERDLKERDLKVFERDSDDK